MRKILLICPLAIVIFAACQRELKIDLNENENIDTNNSSEVSKAIKVWHGVRTPGSPPAPTTHPNSPQLDPSSNNQTIKAIAGRYAVIFPKVISGVVAGYYVQVNSAGEYFKVDFTKPRLTERGRPTSRLNNPNATLRLDSISTVDSAIVIVIPANIQPGTFCISYWAYDSSGNVSNVIANCISVSQFGGDASTDYLAGTWRFDAERGDSTATWIDLDYSLNIEMDTLYCNLDTVNGVFYYNLHCFSTSCSQFYDTIMYEQTIKNDLIFGSNGGLRHESLEGDKQLVGSGPLCSDAPLEDRIYSAQIEGAWSYNSSGSSLILILDITGEGVPELLVFELKLIKETNQQIVVQDLLDGRQYRLKKQ